MDRSRLEKRGPSRVHIVAPGNGPPAFHGVRVPLPTDTKAPWPPPAQVPIQKDIEIADAWWVGDPNRLTTLYAAASPTPQGGRFASFWGKQTATAPRDLDRIHVPLCSDIASTGADLLFGDDLKIQIPEAHGTNANTDAQKSEARLLELVDLVDLAPTLLEGAEVGGALSGVYLRPTWDPSVAAHPLLAVIHPDRAVPEWRWGRLAAVTFWAVVATDGDKVWRHLERHEPGVILTGLYCGSRDMLGVSLPLDRQPATAGFEPEQNITQLLGITGILPRYVPNVRPNRMHRGTPHGRPDTMGLESLMDALDETMTSWMRDIDLGKRRIIVPAEFLERKGRGQGAVFNEDQRVFTPLDIDPNNADKAGITMVDFDIRTEAHAATASQLTEQIIVSAGYSPQSFGLQGSGGLRTATEVEADEGRSERTTAKKQRYWAKAIPDVLEALMVIDAKLFSSGVAPMRPMVTFPEFGQADLGSVAATVALIGQAQAASVETKVKMVHPEWEQPAVDAEVVKILAESGMAVESPQGVPFQ